MVRPICNIKYNIVRQQVLINKLKINCMCVHIYMYSVINGVIYIDKKRLFVCLVDARTI